MLIAVAAAALVLVQVFAGTVVVGILVRALYRRRAPFRVHLALVLWSGVPAGIKTLLVTLMLLVTGRLIVPEGLSGLLGVSVSPLIRALLANMDMFAIWQLVLLTLGISTVHRLPWPSAVLAPLVLWGLTVILRALNLHVEEGLTALPGVYP